MTRFAAAITDSTEGTRLEDKERSRLQETLDHLTSVEDPIHSSLNDVEYATDVEGCEVFIEAENVPFTRQHAQLTLNYRLLCLAGASPPLRYPLVNPLRLQLNSQLSSRNTFRATLSHGRVFGSSFSRLSTQTPSVSRINKHVLLRGYLKAEPKHLVDRIVVTAEINEETKRIYTPNTATKIA
jgi:hypothetical protein